MMTATCCICQRQLSSEIDKKNIFKDCLLIQSDFDKTEEKSTSVKKLRLYTAIELIIGTKVSKSKGSPSILCKQCYRKLEDHINFRTQILISFGKTVQDEKSSFSTQQTFVNTKREESQKIKENSSNDIIKSADCPENSDNHQNPDDLINVDENSDSIDLSTLRNNDKDTNDFTNFKKVQTDQKNNNLNDSDSSNDNIDVLNCIESPKRILNNDLESDIDVCSGDDDEILEIESANKKEELNLSENSSESEIEVCDYEPIGKKTRNLDSIYSGVNI
ncbi:GATOR complex protein WDR24-like [Leptopilina heterotoma]|uniref:GATOR complex protein WDR24-like n=1 Tax=Leptopilina heterotoma TaxID=63436 RepID=UPI001CA85BCF|nr:GATOR complex protein WDR24-like [Leptopilina heterotoma]